MSNYLNYGFRIQLTVPSGTLQNTTSTSGNICQSKVYIRECVITCRYTDSITSSAISAVSYVSFDNNNTGNQYSSAIPGISSNYFNQLNYGVTNFEYLKTGFFIQPGDQFRITVTVNLFSSPVNNVSCFISVHLIGYQIN